MIRIEGLVKSYGAVKVLRGIDLVIPAGELFAYLGPNGAGKTTTIRILTGQTRLDRGNATLNGFCIHREVLSAKRQVGYVPQLNNLDRDLSVYENMWIHGRLHHMKCRTLRQRIPEMLEYVGMADQTAVLGKHLSGGFQRRLMIARALLHEPQILFMDEPTAGLDAGIRRRLWTLIKYIQEKGTTIFLTTHYIEEAEFLAQRVAFLDEGRIVALDSPKNLMARQGTWAIDQFSREHINTLYFNTRVEAESYNNLHDDRHTLRRVNLEDAFLTLTGKKVT